MFHSKPSLKKVGICFNNNKLFKKVKSSKIELQFAVVYPFLRKH